MCVSGLYKTYNSVDVKVRKSRQLRTSEPASWSEHHDGNASRERNNSERTTRVETDVVKTKSAVVRTCHVACWNEMQHAHGIHLQHATVMYRLSCIPL